MSNSFWASSPSFSASTKASDTAIIEMPRIMLLQIFAAWPVPAPPAWTMVLPIASQDRLGAGEGGVGAADHEGERAAGGAADAARHRGVDHREARRLGRRRDGARGVDVDGGAVDQQGAGRRRGDQPGRPR